MPSAFYHARVDPLTLGELKLLLGTDLQDVYEQRAARQFDRLEDALLRNPDNIVEAALASDAVEMGSAVERLVLLARALPAETARPLLGAIASRGIEEAGAMVEAAVGFDDLPGLVPPRILVAAAASPDATAAWAVTLMDVVVGRWQWPEIARLLDASAVDGLAAPWLTTALEAGPWAAKNPVPDPDRPGEVALPSLERERARVPYDRLFPAGDERVVRAASEARLVSATARAWHERGQDPAGWLGLVGRSLPGCGDPMCCRAGLFEAALLQIGFNTRAGRYPPDLGAPRQSPADAEASLERLRANPPEPPGPNFWKTVIRRLSRLNREGPL